MGDSVKFDIDDEDMNEKSFEFFRGKGSAADAKTELFRPGEGMALDFSKSDSRAPGCKILEGEGRRPDDL